jgi:hypothetical protein
MMRTALAAASVLALGGCVGAGPRAVPLVAGETLAKHDYSHADTPNKRTALAYLYTAWNDGRVAYARQIYWVPGSFPEPAKGTAPADLPRNIGTPHYTMKQVVEEGDRVVVLAFVKGVGIGQPITTIFGTPGGTKIGDAVVEIFQFAPDGRIARKWDFIQPVSEESYDFR